MGGGEACRREEIMVGEVIEGGVVLEVVRVVGEAEGAAARVGGGLVMARRADEFASQ